MVHEVPDANLKALEGEAHVWITKPPEHDDPVWRASGLAILSQDERARYQQFYFDDDRDHYLAAHVLVRRALSLYTGNDPSEWRYLPNEHGRPEIQAPAAVLGLRFNLTHTRGLCACVVTRDRDCGVDAEGTARSHDLGRIARRMFSPVELKAIGDLNEKAAQLRFYRHWTLREAYIKALGVGLSGSSREFYFVDTDHESPRLVVDNEPSASAQWQLALLKPDNDHFLAVAIRRKTQHLNIVVRTLD